MKRTQEVLLSDKDGLWQWTEKWQGENLVEWSVDSTCARTLFLKMWR